MTFSDETLRQEQLKKLSNHLKEVCGLKVLPNYCTKIPTPTILDWIDNKPLFQYMHHMHSYLRITVSLYTHWLKRITYSFRAAFYCIHYLLISQKQYMVVFIKQSNVV